MASREFISIIQKIMISAVVIYLEGLFWGLPGTMKVPLRHHPEGNTSDLRPAERWPPLPAPLSCPEKGPFVPGPMGTSAWMVLAFIDTGGRPMGPLVPIHG